MGINQKHAQLSEEVLFADIPAIRAGITLLMILHQITPIKDLPAAAMTISAS